MTKTSIYTSGNDRGIVYEKEDFKKVQSLIYKRAGITLGDNKGEMVYGRLAKVVRKQNLNAMSLYLERLEKRNDEALWQEFINALTTNLTAFFRERHHFDVLKDFLKERRNDSIQIWCTAASTGEEPYSIAMTARDAMGPHGKFRILASDIDTQALEHAKMGVYPKTSLKGVPESYVRSTFLRGEGRNKGRIRVKPAIREMISFERINLVDSLPTNNKFDVIFCRNVMIYFNEETQKKILSHFAKVLKPGGLLFAGHSENFSFISNDFKLNGGTVYQLKEPK